VSIKVSVLGKWESTENLPNASSVEEQTLLGKKRKKELKN
jgi:hypothetical protein